MGEKEASLCLESLRADTQPGAFRDHLGKLMKEVGADGWGGQITYGKGDG